tara:strand:- start:156 stop:1016 length:861 start_codon:yes stop_codon:yes gene_type:complete
MPAESLREITMMPSTIETIDTALFEWIDQTLNIHATSNKGWNKVPVLWLAGERGFQVKERDDLRDSNGVLKLPLISLNRTSMLKDPAMKGVAWAHIPNIDDAKGGAITVSRRIGQTKTSNFKNAYSFRKHQDYNFPDDKKQTVYETVTMPVPTYINAMYSVTLKAEYQQQINELMTPFMTKTGQIDNFFITNEGHRFEGFIQGDFGMNNNVANYSNSERLYESTISIKILAYLIGEGKNDERPKITIRENAVQLVQVRERALIGGSPDNQDLINTDLLSKDGFYRE